MCSMKTAFEEYYRRLEKYCFDEYKDKPKVPYSEKLDASALISAPDDEDEVAWAPVYLNEPPNWELAEKQLGFQLCDELKQYYGTCLFLRMNGRIIDIDLSFEPIPSVEAILPLIVCQRNDAKLRFPNLQMLLLGGADANGDDGYSIYYDNCSGSIICFDQDTLASLELPMTLTEIIAKMEAFD